MIEVFGRKMITIKELSDQANISDRTLRKYVAEGWLVPTRLGNKIYITQESWEALVELKTEWPENGTEPEIENG